jgi:hypothetical protein
MLEYYNPVGDSISDPTPTDEVGCPFNTRDSSQFLREILFGKFAGL